MLESIPYILLAAVLAIALDLWLVRWARQRRRRRHGDTGTAHAAPVSGFASRFQSWLIALRRPNQGQPGSHDPVQPRGKLSHITPEAARRNPAGDTPSMDSSKALTADSSAPEWPETLPAWDRWMALELALLLALGLYFTRSLFNLDPSQWPGGNESPLLVAFNLAVLKSLQAGQAPLWDRVGAIGFPLLANPDVSFFNPFVAPLTLLFGAVNGMKLALAVSICFAGLGAWLLAWSMGLRRPGRLWSATVLMLSGSMINHFDSGIYPLGLGAAWMPLTLAAFALILKTNWKWPRLLGIGAMAGLILSGHVYYAVFTVSALGLMLLMWAIEVRPAPHQAIEVAWRRLLAGAGVLAVAGGLTAFVLVPQIELRPRYAYNAANEMLTIDWRYAWLDYVVDNFDYYKTPVSSAGGHPLESYHYIGWMPFACMLFLAPAFQRGRRREMIFLAGLVVLGLVWADRQHLGGELLGTALPFFNWFRFPFRALILGTIGFSILSGFGLDYLMELVDQWQRTHKQRLAIVLADNSLSYLPALNWGKLLVLLAIALYLQGYVKSASRFIGIGPADPIPAETLAWLNNYHGDDDAYFVALDVSWWHFDVYQAGMLWLLPSSLYPQAGSNDLPLKPEPLYGFSGADVPPNAEVIGQFPIGRFVRFRQAMPYAFRADLRDLARQDPAEYAKFVTPVRARWEGPNDLVMTTEANGGERLVAFVAYYPGWEVWVDGQRGRLLRTSDYVSVEALPGVHTYKFVFNPLSFKLGVAISFITLIGIVAYFLPATWWLRRARRAQSPWPVAIRQGDVVGHESIPQSSPPTG